MTQKGPCLARKNPPFDQPPHTHGGLFVLDLRCLAITLSWRPNRTCSIRHQEWSTYTETRGLGEQITPLKTNVESNRCELLWMRKP